MKNRLLIVEDDLYFYEKLKEILEQEGFDVMHFTPSVDKAIERLQQKPDAILIDIYLKGEKNGYDLARYLKENDLKIPFIFLTSYDDHVHFNHALKLGPENFLSKEDFMHKPELLIRQLFLLLSKALEADPERPWSSAVPGYTEPSQGIRGLTSYLSDIKQSGVNELMEHNIRWDEIKFFSTSKEKGSRYGLSLKPNYSLLVRNDNEIFLTAYSLNKICSLTPYYFVRINDKTVVNLLSPLFKGRLNKYNLLLDEEVHKISKTYINHFEDIYRQLYKPAKGNMPGGE